MNKKSSTTKPGNNKWNQERRLEFIEYRLCWNNHINRKDLVNFFGISVPQSSLDLSRYIEMAPNNLEYDRHNKVYNKSSKFKPIYPDICSPTAYLNDILLNATGKMNPNFNYLDKCPSIACFNPPKRKISFEILSQIVYCILHKMSVRITYQSMSSLEPSSRLISPHALGYDGIRWHVRAFCHEKNEFRDFVLSRILTTGKMELSPVDANEDMKWNFVISLHIGANPELPEAQRIAIEMDYGMENGEVIYKCRQALLFYTLKTLRLSPEDEEDKLPSSAKQIVLKNKAEIFMLLNY
jgi:hypothetical protein